MGIIGRLKGMDAFHRNIGIVFLGTSLSNLLNLLYQLLIAHRLSPADFASFNSLLAVFTLFSAPLGTLQMTLAKYTAEFNAHAQSFRIRLLLSGFLRWLMLGAVCVLLVLLLSSKGIIAILKIPSLPSGYILAALLSLSCVMPVFSGGLQGLELFGWLTAAALSTGVLKIILSFILIILGYKITGALGALFISSLIGLLLFYFPLRKYITLSVSGRDINYKEILGYVFPIAVSFGCYTLLVNSDMILVKYFFSPQESGQYSLAQMVGKIFLFLPAAIATVMFPRVSGLKARKMDTVHTLQRSILYTAVLCLGAVVFYNLFPAWVLKVLTGKAFGECVFLGRLFSISMTFFTLLFIIIAYFISVNDARFIKYLVFLTALQIAAIILAGGRSLILIQVILCANSALLLVVFFALLFCKGKRCGT